jgi:class 3 adenylate cyclase/AmiR/NasT family two-component response regulator
MRDPARILVVDDNAANLDILETRLKSRGYEVVTAVDGEDALARVKADLPDLVLLDIMMPKIDGIEVCRRLKADATLPFIPVIMVTAKADSKDIVAGLEAGGDDYLTKPIDQAALVARVKSMLRIKALHDTVERQKTELSAHAATLADWNASLEARVATQVAEIDRMGRLKRFLPPQIADVIVSSGDEKALESHRREVTVVFCDLRGFTSFAETAEPEEVMAVLRDYHAALGEIIFRHEGTLERFIGDGLMVLFNDPVPCPDPAARAVRMAIEMRAAVEALAGKWRKLGHTLGFGVGIAQGYATLGRIGFEGRYDYAAIGTVANLASRLCDEAKAGQILVSQRVMAAIQDLVAADSVGALTLKGFRQAVEAYGVSGLKA